jgi:hypothetical protein
VVEKANGLASQMGTNRNREDRVVIKAKLSKRRLRNVDEKLYHAYNSMASPMKQ